MMYETFSFDFRQLGITVTQLQKDMGYRKEAPDASVDLIISEVLEECETLGSIRAEYRIFENIEFDPLSRGLKIENIFFGINEIVFNHLAGSELIAVFLSTAGEETAIRGREAANAGDPLKGFAYDVIGNEIVEGAAELMNKELDKRFVREGMNLTNRFTPGYCGWNVSDQHKLFTLMPDNFCDISLTESALMKPVKSISGFIGIGREAKRVHSVCRFCNMKDCFYRRP
ncbi:MAG TPA: vitamin B12 dependent-methionine synthase activation domain-containing protein [Bacteroidales bacterium]|jgi:hypothetical protein|nr:vitamin B12 dependent-methionine synthase activation domain-containing protein [Bacteroidales bacterium]HOS72918.1 vitamin B12 dependent-methionine synthase activation domain-containing protein [Bacteroidales bacterium]